MAWLMKRFDVYLVELNPAVGSEMCKTRPCVIVSPNQLNHSNIVIIAPMTSTQRQNLWRVPIFFNGINGNVVLDQIRSVDTRRLVNCWGTLEQTEGKQILKTLRKIFDE